MSEVLFSGPVAFIAKPNTDLFFTAVFAGASEAAAGIPTTAENCNLANGARVFSVEVTLKNDDRLVSNVVFIYESPETNKEWRISGGLLDQNGFLALSSAVIAPTAENGFTRPVVKTICGLGHKTVLAPGLCDVVIS